MNIQRQIDDRRYADDMAAAGITVLKYGIGFHGKHVALAREGRARGRASTPSIDSKNKKKGRRP